MKYVLLACSLGMMLAQAGCDPGKSTVAPVKPVAAAPSTGPSTTRAAERVSNELWRYDDPRCTEDERKAMRAAAAVVGATRRAPNYARDFYFSIRRSASGWDLTVWEIPPGTTPVAGGFTAVHLSLDFAAVSVVGGA